jgi:hypothetical protein
MKTAMFLLTCVSVANSISLHRGRNLLGTCDPADLSCLCFADPTLAECACGIKDFACVCTANANFPNCPPADPISSQTCDTNNLVCECAKDPTLKVCDCGLTDLRCISNALNTDSFTYKDACFFGSNFQCTCAKDPSNPDCSDPCKNDD